MSLPSDNAATTPIVVRFFRTAFQDLNRDLQAKRWLRALGWSVGLVWVLGLLCSIAFMGALSNPSSDDLACQPDGSFSLYPKAYSIWSSTGFFQITLARGSLTFAQAKVVDIVWDVGVGRGGQLLLAIISWREFAKYITICMEDEPVTYRVFRAIFLENEASILSTWWTIKSFIWQRKLRSNVAMYFMAATMVFILAFPTLMSAMSGYDSNVASRVRDYDNNLIPFSSFHKVFYVIHDGWRVGLGGDARITEVSFRDDPLKCTGCVSGQSIRQASNQCELVEITSQYVKSYGLGGTRNESSQFKNVTLHPPVLNISVYESEDKSLGGQDTPGVLDLVWVSENQTFVNQTFVNQYIEVNGRCQNTDSYKWGFSFLQLFVCIILLLAWTIGIYVMWLNTHYAMEARNRCAEEISGEHRAVLELAAAMRTELDIEATGSSLLKEEQLKERIDKEIRGGAVSYSYPDCRPKLHSIWNGLGSWFRAEKWWLLAILVTSTFCATGYLFLPWDVWIWSWSIILGQFWAFCIGTTTGSRLLVIFCSCIVAGITIGGIWI